MKTIFVSKDAKLSRDNNTLIVQTDKGKTRLPAKSIQHIVLTGEAGISTAVLVLCAHESIRVTVLDWNGNVAGIFDPLNAPKAGAVHLAQAKAVMNDQYRLAIANEIIGAGFHNILANLRYRIWRGNSALTPAATAIASLQTKALTAPTIDSLMGYEGQIRATYYAAWKLIDTQLDFGARTRRPPNNPINCLISWFNGLCYAAVKHEIAKTHLDPVLSFLHTPVEARYSLSLDLAEIFKPVLCDTIIFETALRGQIDDHWFDQAANVCRLNEIGRKATLELWSHKLDGPIGTTTTSLREQMRSCALSLEAHLLGIREFAAYRRKI